MRVERYPTPAGESRLYQCTSAELAEIARAERWPIAAVVVDAPYSSRTHESHDDGATQANRFAKDLADTLAPASGDKAFQSDIRPRRAIDYGSWGACNVDDFFDCWNGPHWILSLTDHVLAYDWEELAERTPSTGVDRERYTFAPIACVETASRVRLLGDGPPQWSTWLCVSRPRSRAWLDAWHAKRRAHGLAPKGAYVGGRESKPVVGGKPLWLMAEIVRDYTAPGDLVVDPCAGGGTTLVAAMEAGRVAIGCEPDAGRYEIAAQRMAAARVIGARRSAGQMCLAMEEER